jgi:hypothetical protein
MDGYSKLWGSLHWAAVVARRFVQVMYGSRKMSELSTVAARALRRASGILAWFSKS